MKRRLPVPFVFIAALAANACSQSGTPTSPPAAQAASLASQAGKVDICHRTGSGYQRISVSASAEQAHRAHGDAAPGEAVPGQPGFTFASACGVAAVFDPVADYDAGWLSGSNPNGVWSYGWSSTLTSPITLYTQNYTTTQDCGSSVYRAWNDPSNDLGFTPAVIKNTGPDCSNGNVDIPTGVLTQHFGGTSGADYAHIIFTAPSAGTYTVNITFTGRQNGVDSHVNVLLNGTPVLTGGLSANLQTITYSATLALSAGATIDFVTGHGSNVGLHPGHVGLSGTITGGQ